MTSQLQIDATRIAKAFTVPVRFLFDWTKSAYEYECFRRDVIASGVRCAFVRHGRRILEESRRGEQEIVDVLLSESEVLRFTRAIDLLPEKRV